MVCNFQSVTILVATNRVQGVYKNCTRRLQGVYHICTENGLASYGYPRFAAYQWLADGYCTLHAPVATQEARVASQQPLNRPRLLARH
jgi:hypothetical protein